MRFGLLADIHEDVESLGNALNRFESFAVDKVIVLGDVFDMGARITETVQLLVGAEADGVFGNHDLGFCHEPEERVLAKYDNVVRNYMAKLKAQFEVEDCLVCHGLPHWDAADPLVYYIAEKVEEDGVVDQCLAAVPHRVVFVGHFHRWFLATEAGNLKWQGESPICLESADRYLMVVAAVCDGWCATYDTDSRELTPIRL